MCIRDRLFIVFVAFISFVVYSSLYSSMFCILHLADLRKPIFLHLRDRGFSSHWLIPLVCFSCSFSYLSWWLMVEFHVQRMRSSGSLGLIKSLAHRHVIISRPASDVWVCRSSILFTDDFYVHLFILTWFWTLVRLVSLVKRRPNVQNEKKWFQTHFSYEL